MKNKELTDTQLRALARIHELTGAGRKVGKDMICTRQDVLERLRESGHIHSAAPFAYRFHTVTLTDLGLAALPGRGKDDEPATPAPAGP
jgi:hypothetical protein